VTRVEPVSVWATAQQVARVQRRGRYLPASTPHPGKMLPEIARRAIASYSEPGQLVLDPMCGIGTTLVEAIHLDRHAVGVELEPRWATVAQDNINLALSQGATGAAHAIPGDATDLGCGLLDSYAGRVRLVLTSPPYGSSLHGQVETRHGQIAKYDNRYSHNPRNLAQLPHHRPVRDRPAFHEALRDVLRACRRMLAPDGYLVLTARPYRQQGELVDLPGQLETLAADAGLTLHERLVALLCRLEPGRLVSRPSFFQLRHQRGGTIPRMLLIAHEDVLVFTPRQPRKPTIRTDQ
jgi:tRNA G10  N-methylase Trm11